MAESSTIAELNVEISLPLADLKSSFAWLKRETKQTSDDIGQILESVTGATTQAVASVSAVIRAGAEKIEDGLEVMYRNIDQNVNRPMKEIVANQTKQWVELSKKLGQQFLSGVQSLAGGIMRLTLGVAGLVTAGIAASSMGQVLSFEFERLSRNVAGLLAPEIKKFTDLIRSVTFWIRGLSDEQKEAVASVLKAGAAFLFATVALVPLGAAIWGVVKAVTALKAGLALTTLGAGGLLALIPLLAGTAAVSSSTWEPFQKLLVVIGKLIAALATGLMPLLRIVTIIVESVARVATAILGPLATGLSGFLTAVGSVFDWAASKIEKLANMIVKAAEAMESSGPAASVKEIERRALADLEERAKSDPALAEKLKQFYAREDAARGTRSRNERGELPRRVGGLEDISATWERIAKASVMVGAGGKSTEDQQLDEQKETNRRLDQIKDEIRMKKGDVA